MASQLGKIIINPYILYPQRILPRLRNYLFDLITWTSIVCL